MSIDEEFEALVANQLPPDESYQHTEEWCDRELNQAFPLLNPLGDAAVMAVRLSQEYEEATTQLDNAAEDGDSDEYREADELASLMNDKMDIFWTLYNHIENNARLEDLVKAETAPRIFEAIIADGCNRIESEIIGSSFFSDKSKEQQKDFIRRLGLLYMLAGTDSLELTGPRPVS